MAIWSEMNTGTRTAVGAVVVILFGAGGYGLWQGSRPAVVDVVQPAANVAAVPAVEAPAADFAAAPVVAAPAAAPAADVAAAPVADTAAAAPVVEAPAADVAAAPVVEAPAAAVEAPAAAVEAPAADAVAVPPAVPDAAASLDLVRIEADGTALVAGRAAAGALVSLLANGVEVATATADKAGKFVAMFTMPASASGQMLSMVVTMQDGSKVTADSQVAIAAIAPPVVVADAGVVAPVAEAPVAEAPAVVAPVAEAPVAPAAIVVTNEGVKVMQSTTAVPAEVAANVSIEVIAYPSPTEVQFGGHGAAGLFVRLYLDNAALGDATPIAADGGWAERVAGIAPGIYTLRADQVDEGGKVTSRFETPFKRETPEALAAASATAEVKVAEAAPAVVTADATAPVVAAPAVTAEAATAEAPTTGAATAAAAPAADAVVVADAPATAADPAPAPAAAEVTAPVVAEAPAVEPAPAAEVVAAETPVAEVAAQPAGPVTVTVQPGYTLWGIAQQNFGDGVLYVQVFEANKDKIKNPDLIYPGQVFTLPAK